MSDEASVSYPEYTHVPGANSRHSEGAFDALRSSAEDCADMDALGKSAAWRTGLAYYRRGFFWECHEVLEAVWLACPPNSAERHFVQAIIQLANGRLKLVMDRPGAALRLAEQAGKLLREAGLYSREPLFGVAFGFVEAEIGRLEGDAAAAKPGEGKTSDDNDRKYNA